MKKTRRHKFLQISLLFLIYSIIHVYSEKSQDIENPPVNQPHKTNVPDERQTAQSPPGVNQPNHPDKIEKIPPTSPPIVSTTPQIKATATSASTTIGTTHTTVGTTVKTTTHSKIDEDDDFSSTSIARTTVPTLRPKRKNCTPPAIEQVLLMARLG